MNLILITNQRNQSVWINPEHVVIVYQTYIGHKSQGVIGTGIQLRDLNPIKTRESIESVIERLQGGE